MVGNRTTLPTYQQVFGQDVSDDEFDDDAKGDLGRETQQGSSSRQEDEQLLVEQKRNPWQEDGSYSPVEHNARGSRINRRARASDKAEFKDSQSPERYSTSDDSLVLDDEKLEFTPPRQPSRIAHFFRAYVLPTTLVILFFLIAFGAYRASKNHYVPGQSDNQTTILAPVGTLNTTIQTPTGLLNTSTTIQAPTGLQNASKYAWNGTALFAPTTIVISLDGFRADFLQRNLTPTLNLFVSQGVSPQYMLPSFPSVTFPNHFTMVTGLYPESHGVVGNTFWDPQIQQEFSYHDPSHSMQPMWWNGEPIWVTAESQGVRSAAHMWPGSEAHIGDFEPAFLDKYNGTEELDLKVQRILELIDRPGAENPNATDQRPQLVLAYVPDVDHAGHLYGPNSTEMSDTIMAVDTMLLAILDGLNNRNLTNIVNVVVVSDHGMATTSVDRLVPLEELVDMDTIEHIDGWPHFGLRPKNQDPEVLQMMYNRLLTETAHRDGFDVYLRDTTMPERYHFSNNDRIAPLWLIAKTGWAIVTPNEMQQALVDGYHPRGIHGYDNEHPLMRAIFVARGPAFPHQANSRIDVFQNTEVYNIVCDSVGIVPTTNNGTLRLPFKPIGLHSDFDDVEEDKGLTADPPMTSFIPQVSTIWKELATATVASDMLGFIRPTSSNHPGEPSKQGTNGSDTGDVGEYNLNDVSNHQDGWKTNGFYDGASYDGANKGGYDGATKEGTLPSGHPDNFRPDYGTTPGEVSESSQPPSSGFSDHQPLYDEVIDDNKPQDTSTQGGYASNDDSEHRLDFEPARPVLEDGSEQQAQGEGAEKQSSWFGWFGDKFDDVKGWVSGLFSGGDDGDAA